MKQDKAHVLFWIVYAILSHVDKLWVIIICPNILPIALRNKVPTSRLKKRHNKPLKFFSDVSKPMAQKKKLINPLLNNFFC